MKLIEKLADESVKNHPEYYTDDDGLEHCYCTGFKAGFSNT